MRALLPAAMCAGVQACADTVAPLSGGTSAREWDLTRHAAASPRPYSRRRGYTGPLFAPGKARGSAAPPVLRGAALMLKLLNSSCSRCSANRDHADHFLVNINTRRPPPLGPAPAGASGPLHRPAALRR